MNLSTTLDRLNQIPNSLSTRERRSQLTQDLPIIAPILQIGRNHHHSITASHPDLGMVRNDLATYLLHFTDSQILQQKGVTHSHVF